MSKLKFWIYYIIKYDFVTLNDRINKTIGGIAGLSSSKGKNILSATLLFLIASKFSFNFKCFFH